MVQVNKSWSKLFDACLLLEPKLLNLVQFRDRTISCIFTRHLKIQQPLNIVIGQDPERVEKSPFHDWTRTHDKPTSTRLNTELVWGNLYTHDLLIFHALYYLSEIPGLFIFLLYSCNGLSIFWNLCSQVLTPFLGWHHQWVIKYHLSVFVSSARRVNK